ncbi:ParA family protein [Spartinivicinus marinus]|uniref:ParA family protein n=1 Tax=Spartinivicinus marinus TaxID=2994442 RepID=UPI001C5C8F80|nr:ParA family protein [Spartinivicinus marinus]
MSAHKHINKVKKIVAFANSKGGVSKTSTCLGVASCCAELGYKTLVVDLDHQANLSDDVGRGDEDYTITDLFENPKFDINKIVYPALDNGNAISNLWVVPADITLAVEARAAERFRHRLHIIEDGLKKLKQDFDICFFDCRPAIDLTIENALLLSDMVVIPVNMDKRATKGINDLFEVTKEIKRTDDFMSLIVKTMFDRRNKVMIRAIEEELSNKGWKVANSVVSVSESFKQATKYNRPFTSFANDSRQHNELRALANELLDSLQVEGRRFNLVVEEDGVACGA